MLLASGCGRDRVPLGHVSGTVTYHGKPLEQGAVVFFPAQGRSSIGTIKDGKIVDVSTYDPADGVSLGMHKVTITARDNPQADMYKATKSIIPDRYSDANRSNLTADIKSGENQFTFALED